ncbi:zinc-dependent alcohol dehydrogenase family protein [Gulosibacter molinativorax]|uniref:alcohol dehydrogenase n=1 Tax=Gulosibacter molinativorax TaxID=256821 RepID=A0ABT7C6C0_9MICO|nr:zinc-dependent alcohol dehydrogenase family protein [Gulosibacter molinativorax]MDJ1370319.1 zinc-binding alcohol dehydrogenase family protein [Gulosibacter molinativorax]QUY61230.1 Putative alcohol dehydrogenase AdhA [Gulosibacter molinativorax]
MRAWKTGPRPGELALTQVAEPEPGPGEVRVRVEVCGVCRTDLHVVDQELPVHRPNVTPGHQVVGVVDAVGHGVLELRLGDRVGIAWLRHTCGVCQWCRSGSENLCPSSAYTGWDADGGFAEYATVPEAYAYRLPSTVDAAALAPLLCAGIIGYRALKRAALPPGGRLGIYGFGSSGHITAQLAAASGAEIFVMTRGTQNQQLARDLGATFVGDAYGSPPVRLDSAIVFAPAGELVPIALRATTPGGTVALAGIHMSDIPTMTYRDHLFDERDLRTVTANTRADGIEFLRVAEHLGLRATVTTYDFNQVAVALDDLRSGRASGSLVVTV